MNLFEKVKSLPAGAKLRVVLLDGSVLTGQYEAYTSAINNDPEIASIDLKAVDGVYELYENEIKSIELV